MVNCSPMELTDSSIINQYEASQTCTIVLKFMWYASYEKCSTFFLNCLTADDVKVVCYGRLELENGELSKMKKESIIELSDVIVGNPRPRPGYVKHDFKIGSKTRVEVFLENGESQQILPLQRGKLRRSESTHSLKSVKFLDHFPNSSDDFDRVDMDENCTMILKVVSYWINKDLNLTFINCETGDDEPVTVATKRPFTEKLLKDDVVKFDNVTRNKPKKVDRGLFFHEKSQAYLLERNGESIEPPKELTTENCQGNEDQQSIGREFAVDKSETGSVSSSTYRKSSGDLNVTGTLTSDFKEMRLKGTQTSTYLADVELDDGSKIKLLIDANFGKWPSNLLKKGHRVSIGGKKVKYDQDDARQISKGDHFDFDNLPPKKISFH
uniref:Uncharacterized protein n=1 Tax=Panagrolaimus sp. JU765 TaxID=591449 RepID=A0AC34REK2_9BILA